MSSSVFKTGDKVLCFHQGLYYDAKCIASKQGPDGDKLYRIHYIGWKPKWDEWISEKVNRIKEHNAVNIKERDALKEQKARTKRSKKGKAKATDEVAKSQTPTPVVDIPAVEEASQSCELSLVVIEKASTPATDDSVMQCTEPTINEEAAGDWSSSVPSLPMQVKLVLPTKIEKWLVDDCFQINNLKKLPIIPAQPNVQDILGLYQKYRLKKMPPTEHAHLVQTVNSIEELFNKSCGSRLMYNYEHPHYREKAQEFKGTPMSRLYGFPHFLRLFHVMRHIIEVEKLADIATARDDVEKILDYLTERGDEFYVIVNLYGVASAEYTRLAQQTL